MTPSHLNTLTTAQLVLIDIQVKLCGAMPAEPLAQMLKSASRLAEGARCLGLPALATEQYPQGLGETVPEIQAFLSPGATVSKTVFSALRETRFAAKLHRDKPQIILAGMEAHICVLQTAMDLLAAGKQVFVVEDAIISRNPLNKANALARMQAAGCIVTNTESVLFECLGDATHEAFKSISKLIR